MEDLQCGLNSQNAPWLVEEALSRVRVHVPILHLNTEGRNVLDQLFAQGDVIGGSVQVRSSSFNQNLNPSYHGFSNNSQGCI